MKISVIIDTAVICCSELQYSIIFLLCKQKTNFHYIFTQKAPFYPLLRGFNLIQISKELDRLADYVDSFKLSPRKHHRLIFRIRRHEGKLTVF